MSVLALLALPAAHAAVWYADPALAPGAGSGPFLSVEEAIGERNTAALGAPRVSSPVRPGDTVVLLAGTHDCRGLGETNTLNVWRRTNTCAFGVSGTAAAPITYVADTTWGFTFQGGVTVRAEHVRIERVHVENPDTVDRANTATNILPPGVEIFGDDVTLRHALVENVGHPGIAAWSGAADKVLEGNIVRFAGMLDQTAPSTPNWVRGSGAYLQNGPADGEALVAGNIVYGNWTAGLKAFGSGNQVGPDQFAGPVDDFSFLDNIVTDTASYGGLFVHRKHGALDGLVVAGNVVFEPRTAALTLGHPSGSRHAFSGAQVDGNHASSRGGWTLAFVQGWTGNLVQDNVLDVLGSTTAAVTLSSTNAVAAASHVWLDNRVRDAYAPASAPRARYGFNGLTRSLTDFLTTIGAWLTPTRTAVSTAALPTQHEVTVIAPSADPDFVHVAVNAWGTDPWAFADLSAYFAPGDTLVIYDAQEAPRAYTTVVYTGGRVALDLTPNKAGLATHAGSRWGGTGWTSGAWTGFDPRFAAFVIERVASAEELPAVGDESPTAEAWATADAALADDLGLDAVEGSPEDRLLAMADDTAPADDPELAAELAALEKAASASAVDEATLEAWLDAEAAWADGRVATEASESGDW